MRKLVDGSESMLAEALAYLARRGLPSSEIRSLEILGEVGTPLRLRVELFVEEAPAATGTGWPEVPNPLDATRWSDGTRSSGVPRHPTCIDVTQVWQPPRSEFICGPECPQ